jgi:hypothetical protein
VEEGNGTERVNVVVLASLLAALAMFGLRFWANAAAPDPMSSPATLAGFFPTGGVHDRKLPPSRIALYSRRREAPRPEGAPPAPEERRQVRAVSMPGAPTIELIAGVARRRPVLEAARAGGTVVARTIADEAIDGMGGSLIAGVPSGRSDARDSTSAPVDTNKVHTFELLDGAKPAPEVLLSIPFDGGVDPTVGGASINADGLVTDGGSVEFPDGAQLSFPAGDNVHGNGGTISFDLRPQWAGDDPTDNSFVQIREEHVWENTLGIEKNLDALRFIIIDSVGVERNVNIPIDNWTAGDEHQLTATWSQTHMALYVDGQLVGQNALDNPFDVTPTTPVHIGSDFQGSSFAGAGGTIRDFTIYGRALTAQEVAAL